tara:strand:- start:318 stop:449 length:132 start_codon:yes stop_codon:yes gene_type:complete
MEEIISDLSIVIEAIKQGDNKDAITMIKEIQNDLKYQHLININ